MKKLGLIGGTGPESTLIYYRELNHRIAEATGGEEFPEIVLESINLARGLGYVKRGEYDALEAYLGERIQHLCESGAEVVALTAATMHIIFDRLEKYAAVPLIGIPAAASKYAKEQGYRKLGLLGTIFTMEQDFVKKAFVEEGLEIVVPTKAERELVNERIANELELGIVKESSVEELLTVVRRMKEEEGIEALILGCTELPLALSEKNCPLPCLDIMDIHIDRLIELISK